MTRVIGWFEINQAIESFVARCKAWIEGICEERRLPK